MNNELSEIIKQEHIDFNKNMDEIINYLRKANEDEAASKIQEIKDNANEKVKLWIEEGR